MFIKLNVDEILPHLMAVASIVNAKNAMPILDDVLFEPFKSQDGLPFLKMTASDNDNRISIVAQIEELSGDLQPFCLSAKNFLQILRNLTGAQLTLEVDCSKSPMIKGIYKNGKFSLPIDNAHDFPPEFYSPVEEERVDVTVTARKFAKGIMSVAFAVAEDTLRPQLNAIRVDFTQNNYSLVATDSQKLIKFSDCHDGNVEGGFTLPIKPAHLLRTILAKSNENLSISFDSKNVVFKVSNLQLHSRIIDGRYPNYNAVIPTDNDIVVEIGKDNFISALRRAMVLGDQKSNMIKLSFELGCAKIEAEDIDFSTSASENIYIDYQYAPLKIGFNGTNLLQIIQNISDEKICIKLKEPSRAALFSSSTSGIDGMQCLSILMPMMINS